MIAHDLIGRRARFVSANGNAADGIVVAVDWPEPRLPGFAPNAIGREATCVWIADIVTGRVIGGAMEFLRLTVAAWELESAPRDEDGATRAKSQVASCRGCGYASERMHEAQRDADALRTALADARTQERERCVRAIEDEPRRFATTAASAMVGDGHPWPEGAAVRVAQLVATAPHFAAVVRAATSAGATADGGTTDGGATP